MLRVFSGKLSSTSNGRTRRSCTRNSPKHVSCFSLRRRSMSALSNRPKANDSDRKRLQFNGKPQRHRAMLMLHGLESLLLRRTSKRRFSRSKVIRTCKRRPMKKPRTRTCKHVTITSELHRRLSSNKKNKRLRRFVSSSNKHKHKQTRQGQRNERLRRTQKCNDSLRKGKRTRNSRNIVLPATSIRRQRNGFSN